MRRALGVLCFISGLYLLTVMLEVFVPDRWLEAASPWLVFGMAIPATGFPLLYLTFWRWHRNPIGRALMTKAIGLLLLIDFSVYFALTNDQWGWKAEITFIVFLTVMVGLWYQFLVFGKIRLAEHREKKAAKAEGREIVRGDR